MKYRRLITLLAAILIGVTLFVAAPQVNAQSPPMVAAGYFNTVGVQSDGTVVAVGNNDFNQLNVGGWTGIAQVAAGGYHTVGLKSDGTVVAVGWNGFSQRNVGGWTGIVQVAAGDSHTVGLKSDGSVVAVGYNLYGQRNVGGWTGIAQVAAGYFHTVGVKSDGTVVAVGNNAHGRLNVGGWTGIAQVAAGGRHTVGLKSDGTVVAVGDNTAGQLNVGGWTGIVQVAAGDAHTVGLRSDGTVVAVGNNDFNQLNVGGWTGIAQVAAGDAHTVGLKSDGTVVAVGDNGDGQLNVGGWNLELGTDLDISKADDTDPVIAGNDLTYTITVTNNGPANATGVSVADTLPSGVTFKSADTHGKGTYHSGAGVWTVGGLAYQEIATLTLVVTVKSPAVDGTVLTNTAQVTGNETDSNLNNNAATQDTQVKAPNMEFTKTAYLVTDADGDGVASPGDTIGYNAIITNVGSVAATGVTFSDTPDYNTTLVVGRVTTTQGSVMLGNNPGAKSVRVHLGNIPSQRSAQVSFQVTINTPLYGVNKIANQGVIDGNNIFSVQSDDPDTPQPDDPTITGINPPLLPPGVPSVSQWGSVTLSMLLGIVMVWMIWRRQIRSETH